MTKPTVTIGIPTSFAGESLLETARTISLAQKKENYNLKIYADRTPISTKLRQQLKTLKFEVHWTPDPGSFLKKVRKLIAATNTDILIITQDDIIFDRDTISATVASFRADPKISMISARILPLSPETRFESMMASMVRLVDKIARYWNDGDNYLAASGRYLAFRTAHLKKLPIPEVVNGDMYLYLANSKYGGKFYRAEKAKVYIRCPQRLADQLKPSNRFQYSKQEMEKYFSTDLTSLYRIPVLAILKGFIKELVFDPIALIGYIFIFIYTRIFRIPAKKIMKTVWKIDTSTKNIIS